MSTVTEKAILPTASILTHNGTWTVHSTATGEWRTFRVRTQPADSDFAPGKRLVAVLIGQDNHQDYLTFGMIGDRGGIIVWKKHRGTQYERMARMLTRLSEHEAAGRVEVLHEGRCRRCNRKLTTPESIKTGIGPTCAGRE